MIPRLWFLRRPHRCNYCQSVDGVTFDHPPKVQRRLSWVLCKCGRRHYICLACSERVGFLVNGQRYVAKCARGYYKHEYKPMISTGREPVKEEH